MTPVKECARAHSNCKHAKREEDAYASPKYVTPVCPLQCRNIQRDASAREQGFVAVPSEEGTPSGIPNKTIYWFAPYSLGLDAVNEVYNVF